MSDSLKFRCEEGEISGWISMPILEYLRRGGAPRSKKCGGSHELDQSLAVGCAVVLGTGKHKHGWRMGLGRMGADGCRVCISACVILSLQLSPGHHLHR